VTEKKAVMKTSLVGVAFLCTCLAVAACGNAKNQRVTKENKDSLFQQIKDSQDLTVEEVGLLQAFVLHQGLGDARSGKDPELPVGMTIGEMIDEQRKWNEDTKRQQDQEKRRMTKARAEEEAQRVTLRDALTVTVFDKAFQNVAHQDYVTIRVAYENTSGKDIRGFKGVLQFNDLFGAEIVPFTISEDEPLRMGETKRQGWTLKYNQFKDEHVKLRNTVLDNLKIDWKPQIILFSDGTSMEVKTSSIE
jgi:hypothetical protein